MVLLFAAYLFLPKSLFAKFGAKDDKPNTDSSARLKGSATFMPEDSVLKRHYITQLRSEIEMELFPRPTDSTLQRHYDSLVAAELENRLEA